MQEQAIEQDMPSVPVWRVFTEWFEGDGVVYVDFATEEAAKESAARSALIGCDFVRIVELHPMR